MFSSWVCDPALGRPVAFADKERLVLQQLAAVPKLAGVMAASRLEVRPAPEMASSGICEMDALTGGLPRGRLTEVCGVASSGRTSVLLAALAAATQRQEACTLVDASDAFDPASAAAAGVDFGRLLWVRCGGVFSPQRHPSTSLRAGSDTEKNQKKWGREDRVEQALRAADLLLQSGGFGLVAMDLGDVSVKLARRIPLTSWFRFQRVVENTPTILLAVTPVPCAQSCAALLVKVQASVVRELSVAGSQLSETPSYTQLLGGLQIEGEILCSRLGGRVAKPHTSWVQRKPAQSVTAAFATKAVRAG